MAYSIDRRDDTTGGPMAGWYCQHDDMDATEAQTLLQRLTTNDKAQGIGAEYRIRRDRDGAVMVTVDRFGTDRGPWA